jgi:hypothetical protein
MVKERSHCAYVKSVKKRHKEVLQKESGRRLCYIYIAVVHTWSFSAISGASSVQIWHPPRTGIEKGSEEGRGRGNAWGQKASIVRNFTTKLDWAAVNYPHA